MRISDWSSDVCSSDLTMAEIGKARYRRLKSVASRGDDQTIIGQHFGRAVHALQTDNALPCIDRVDPSGTEIDIGRGEQLAEGRRHRRGIAFIEARSEEHKSELQSLMRNSYAVFCLKKKN